MNEAFLKQVLDSTKVGIFLLDGTFQVVWVNRAIEQMFGIQREMVIGKDKRTLIEQKIKYIFEDPDAFASIYEGVYAGGRIEQYYDVTFLRKVQDQLEKQLKEKELLLREVHHRIKNNIASISSLISLQKEKYGASE